MALTAAKQLMGGLAYRVTRSEREAVTDFTFDGSYATGGLAVTPSAFGLNKINSVLEIAIKTPSAGAVVNVFYDDVNSKLKAFTATAEVANAVDLSALV